MIEIDGSVGESGGQIVRTSLTLSALTQKPVRISNIRKNRPNPGLAMQHLTGAKAVRSICRGELEGAEVGSTELIFHPGKIIGGKYDFNIGTAGSVTLVAQTILPILLFAEKSSTIRILGGTHVFKSPGYDYFEKIFLPAINLFGAKVSSRLLQTGYYPVGGGEIELEVSPSKLNGNTEWPKEEKSEAIIRLGSLPTHVGVREKKILVENSIEKIRFLEEKTPSPGNSVTVWNGSRGAYACGEKGKRAEDVAKEAVESLQSALLFDVDERLADQLLIYAILAEGTTSYSTPRITQHLQTNKEIIEKFSERKIRIEENTITVE